MDAGALIIATATGSGFGGALALATWRRETVLEHVARVVTAAGIEDLTIVVGPRAYEIAESVDLGAATFVIDPEWEEGRASALRAGLDTMWRNLALTAAVVADLERPGIDTPTVEAILERHDVGATPVTLAKYRYARGGPYAVARELWPHLMGLEGDVDLTGLFEARRDWVSEVWIDRVPPSRVRSSADLDAAVGR